VSDELVPNQPPNIPLINLDSDCPPDGAADQSRKPQLSWLCSDSDSNFPLTYNVYFGATSPPPIVAQSVSETEYYPDELGGGMTYYWRVTAIDIEGLTTESPIWQFSTASNPELCVSPLVWQPASGGDIKFFEVTDCATEDERSFTVDADDSWLGNPSSTFLTPGGFSISAEANSTGFPRTGQIVVSALGLLGSPKSITVIQGSSIEPYIEVRNGFPGSPVTVVVQSQDYAIGEDKVVRIPLTTYSTQLCIWECPVGEYCTWDCAYTVRVGQRYAVVFDERGPTNNLILVGD